MSKIPKGYKQTEIGVIPEDWEVKKLGEISELLSSKRIFENDYVSSGIPFYRGKEISSLIEGSSLDDLRFITEEKYEFIRKQYGVPQKCDILVTAVGTIGNVYIVPNDDKFYFKDGNLIWIRNIRNVVLTYFAMQISQYKDIIITNSIGSSQKALTIQVLKKVPIPIPSSIVEQTCITDALNSIGMLIKKLEKVIEKKYWVKQGAMQALLTGKIRIAKFSPKVRKHRQTELGVIPEDWRACRFEDVLTGFSSGMTPYRGKPEYYKGDIRWITSGELNYNVITDTQEHITREAVTKTNLKILPKGTFLMAITGLEAEGTRGSCGIVGEEATTNQSCMALFPITGEITTEYLYHFYVLYGNELALRYCQGTKQQSYTGKIARKLPINLPPTIEEQTQIASILSNMDTEIAALEAKLAKYKKIKEGMMQNLLTGRIRLI